MVAAWLARILCALGALGAADARAQAVPTYAPIDLGRPDIAVRPAEPPRLAGNAFAPLRYAVQAEPAFGVTGGSFYNQLAGVRVDYRFTEQIALGGYLGYANLKGKEGRAHDVLPYVNLEYRPRLGTRSAFGLPLGFGTGYLPNNGPFLRLSAAISYAVSPQTDIVFAFFTPTFWVIHDKTVVSLGAALEISYAP
jgi:hypothetical protein